MVLKIPTRLGLKQGDKGEDVEELQSYLKKFGYIGTDRARAFGGEIDKRVPTNEPNRGVFDDTTENALRLFQEFYKLPVTGNLNKQTVNLLSTPRCGVRDLVGEAKRFEATGTKWDKTSLTYKFENFTPDLDQTTVKKAIETAFQQWSSVSPLTFTEAQSPSDIALRWGAGEHGCGIAFDGPSQVLAHAYFPGTGKDGIVDFDEDELWSDNDPPTGTDLASVALHEFGHTLGLRHSNNRQAIMYAYYGGRLLNLFQDDIEGIQSIYGAKS